jgi:membrane protein
MRALPLLAAAVVLGGAASALVVFGQSIGHGLKGAVPVAGSAFVVAWTVARWAASIGLIGLLFSVIYSFAPNRTPRKWRFVSPGSVVGTLIWAGISVAFSFYTSVSGSYSKTYGAFAGVAILIFWLYLTGLAILIGGEINAAAEQTGRG